MGNDGGTSGEALLSTGQGVRKRDMMVVFLQILSSVDYCWWRRE